MAQETEQTELTFEDMAEDAVERILTHDPGAPSDVDTDAPAAEDKEAAPEAAAAGSPPAADADVEEKPSVAVEATDVDEPPTGPDAEDKAAAEAAPSPTVGSVWAHVPEEARQKVLAIARKADGQRAPAAAEDEPGTDQAPAADADKPVVDVAKEVLTGTLTREEVTAKINAVRADGYDELADAMQATADFAAQQTREAGDAARAVVNLVEAIDHQQATEKQEEDDVQLFAAALGTRPSASDDQLILVRRMVNQGVVTPAEGGNPYDLAFQQLEGAGIDLGAAAAETPRAESTAKRGQRKLAAAAGSSSDGAAETPLEVTGFDDESVLKSMDDGSPMFAGLQKPPE